MEPEHGTLINPSPAEVKVGKWHKRTHHIKADETKFDELVKSIEIDGVVSPILVRPVNGHLELVHGTRRLAAAKAAKLETIPAFSRTLTDVQARRITLAENLHREDLTPLETAETIAELIAAGLTYAEIGAEISRTKKWVAMRANIRNLSPAWKKAIEDEKLEVSAWPASLLAEVARVPHAIQDRLQDYKIGRSRDGYVMLPTLEEFRSELAADFQLLDYALWALDDAKVAKGCAACLACPSRSDHVPELFELEDFDTFGKNTTAPGVRCLDQKCWSAKVEASVRREIDTAKAEKKDLVLIRDGYSNKTFAGAKTIGRYDFQESTQKAGGKPAIIVDGPEAGKRLYVKPGKASTSRPTSSTKGAHAAATPLREKRKNYNRLRRRDVAADLVNQLDDILDDKADPPKLSTAEKLAIVSVWGAQATIAQNNEKLGVFALVKDRAGHGVENLVDLLFRGGLSMLRADIHYRGTNDRLSEDDLRVASTYIGLDYDELFAKAVEAKPEPKGWAKLKADGSPKKAAGTRKAKAKPKGIPGKTVAKKKRVKPKAKRKAKAAAT